MSFSMLFSPSIIGEILAENIRGKSIAELKDVGRERGGGRE